MPERKRIPERSILVYLFWWVQWALMQIYIIHHYGFSWQIAIADSLITNLLLTGVLFGTNNIMKFYQPFSKNWSLGLIWNVCIAFISLMLFRVIVASWLKDETSYLHFVERTMVLRFCFSLLLITCSSMISWIWSQLIELRENENRKSETEKLARESELMRLRQQLQPHFLFNSLNSISALTGSKPEEARKMIQQLSDFLRSTLRKDDQQLVTLEDELNHLQLYLEIEKVRFGHRLKVTIDADGCNHLQLPALLMQPIVENAIKFGLYDTIGETTIEIRATQEGGQLHLRVINPYDPTTTRSTRGTGFGLTSVERRLYLLYGRNDLLSTKMEEGQFITQLIIPQQS